MAGMASGKVVSGNPGVIDALAGVLSLELTAVDCWLAWARVLKASGYKKLAHKMTKKSKKAHHRAENMMDRILFLGGTYDTKQVPGQAPGDVPAMLEAGASLGRQLLVAYQAVYNAADGDAGTRYYIKKFERENEDLLQWIVRQQALLSDLGLVDYLTEKAV